MRLIHWHQTCEPGVRLWGVRIPATQTHLAAPECHRRGAVWRRIDGVGPSGTFSGLQIQSRYGPVQVSLVVENGQITDVKVSNAPDTARSVLIQDQAVPLLKQEALKEQSAGIHMISGATITSRAFEQSLQSALSKAGM